MSARVTRLLVAAGFFALTPFTTALGSEDIVARARAAYGALGSYSDAGTIDTELNVGVGQTIREHHTFRTHFRAPRRFYFEFNEDRAAGADRFVVWSDDETFHTWWKDTGVKTAYPRGQGVAALISAFGSTKGAASVTTPLLFPQADLRGALNNFEEGKLEGTEEISGRKCHRVKGVQRSAYGTGRGESVRATVLWIDAETLLLRKMFEDTPRGSPAASVNRVITVFEPQANPSLQDAQFRFTPPN
jgi:outer membrane lipoprotein-sorting protein